MLTEASAGRPFHATRDRRFAALKLTLIALLCAHFTACAIVDHEQRRWIFMPTKST